MKQDDFWIAFLRGTGFPRDLGFWNRVKVNNKNEYLDLIKKNLGKKHIGVQIFSDKQIENNVFDCIFMDFDTNNGEEFEKCFREVMKIKEKIGECRIYYSGARGFHIYIDFFPLMFDYRAVISEYLKNNIESKYLDKQASIDKKRIARLPYTINVKTNEYCLPLKDGENISTLKKRAKNIKEMEDIENFEMRWNNRVRNELLSLEKEITNKDSYIKLNNNKMNHISNTCELPYCIRKFLKELKKNGDLDHYKRFQLATFLLQFGMPKEEIENIFRNYANDFREDKTEYQIKYFIMRDMKPFGCRKAKAIMLCDLEVQEICPFYPSIYRVLRGI